MLMVAHHALTRDSAKDGVRASLTLHDTGHSGWWTLLVLPTSGLGLLLLALFPGNKAANKYGEVPPSEPSHLLHFWRAKKVL
jgi:Protein of unknown function (DUF805)